MASTGQHGVPPSALGSGFDVDIDVLQDGKVRRMRCECMRVLLSVVYQVAKE